MDPKIDAKELDEIVGEVARIQRAEGETLDQEQAREVLRELDLPADRLEEAREAVAVNRAVARERTVRLRIAGAVVLVLVLVAAGLGFRAHTKNAALERMTVSAATLSTDGTRLSGALARNTRAEIAFDVSLMHPPQGDPIDLTCDWKAPGGDVRHQNHWKTKEVDSDPWPTHCRYRFAPSDPAGAWTVTMKQGDRTLATERFDVE